MSPKLSVKKTNSKCTICLEPILDSKRRTLRCSHTFHCACIRRWMRIRHTCPLCNVPIGNRHRNDRRQHFLHRRRTRNRKYSGRSLSRSVLMVTKFEMVELPLSAFSPDGFPILNDSFVQYTDVKSCDLKKLLVYLQLNAQTNYWHTCNRTEKV